MKNQAIQQSKKKSLPVLKVFSIIITIILIGVILTLAYYIYLNLPRDPELLTVSTNPTFQIPTTSDVNQFYPNMKFNHKQITYRIDRNCEEKKKEKMELAFKELSTQVPELSFISLVKDPDIEITCEEKNQINIDKKHFVAGEGGAKEIIQTGRYNIINEGIILLYENTKVRSKDCEYPNVEMHELLHVFGFDHSEDKKSIMYPFIETCSQVLDQSIIDQLNTIYKEDNLPDLYFEKIQASKKGRYLDFDLTIKNSGSIKSETITLTILDGTDIIEQKDLEEIEYGAGITLTTTNLKLKRLNPDQINFIIDKEDKIKELDESNNVANIKLSE